MLVRNLYLQEANHFFIVLFFYLFIYLFIYFILYVELHVTNLKAKLKFKLSLGNITVKARTVSGKLSKFSIASVIEILHYKDVQEQCKKIKCALPYALRKHVLVNNQPYFNVYPANLGVLKNINPFVPNVTFLYLAVFGCFQEVEKRCIENEQVKKQVLKIH